MRRALTIAGLAVGAVLLLAAAASPRGIKEGGTFKVAVAAGFFPTIDPVWGTTTGGTGFEFMRGTCGALMSYPDLAPPAGYRLAPDLAEAEPLVSRDRLTYTFTVRKDARFSDGTKVTARAFARAFERILDPKIDAAWASDWAAMIVGGDDVLAGKTISPAGVVAKGRTLMFRLTKRRADFPARTASLCAVPPSLPVDAEGAKAPLSSPAPYYVAEYVPGERVVLARNRYYNGTRPHHLDRVVARINADEGSIVDEIASGKVDWGWVTNTTWAERTEELGRRYGVNKRDGQFFVNPLSFVRMFVLNTNRPLFRNNVKLRQAVNFAVDRKALTDLLGKYVGTATDHYLPGHKSERIYPLKGPDLGKARKLAKGRRGDGKAVLYTRDTPVDVAQAQILQQNLKAIGLQLDIQLFPGNLIFDKLATGRNAFDIGRTGFGDVFGPGDPAWVLSIFDGRTIRQGRNFSYFNSATYNRLLDAASRLAGQERYDAYYRLDTKISRDAAPAIPYAFQNAITFVSRRTGCVVRNPLFDVTAACLK